MNKSQQNLSRLLSSVLIGLAVTPFWQSQLMAKNNSNVSIEKSLPTNGNFLIPYRIESAGKISNQRRIGDGKFFIPILQDQEANQLLFADLRGRFDGYGSKEYNYAFGYRKLINDYQFMGQKGWIFGGFLSFDRLESRYKSKFLQRTLGLEALSDKYDLRANFYLPENKSVTIESISNFTTKDSHDFDVDSVPEIQGIKDLYGDYLVKKERAQKGMDFEIGYKLPIKYSNVKIFGGGYYFHGSNHYQSVFGPRIRTEWLLDRYNICSMPKNLTFGLNSEYSHDNVRGDQVYAGIKLSYQFGRNYQDSYSSYNHPHSLKARMNEFVVRDVDIISNQKANQTTDRIYALNNNQKNAPVYVIDKDVKYDGVAGINTDLYYAIDDVRKNAIIIHDGSKGDFVTTKHIIIPSGQRITTNNVILDVLKSDGNTLRTTVKYDRAKIQAIDTGNLDLASSVILFWGNNVIENFDLDINLSRGSLFASGSEIYSAIQLPNDSVVTISGVKFTLSGDEDAIKRNFLNVVFGASNINLYMTGRGDGSVDIDRYHRGFSLSYDETHYPSWIYFGNLNTNARDLDLALPISGTSYVIHLTLFGKFNQNAYLECGDAVIANTSNIACQR